MHAARGTGAGSTLFPEGCAGTTWRIRHLACMTLLPNPPLTTGSFLATIFFEDVASVDCTAARTSIIS